MPLFDRAEVELAFRGGMLGESGRPQLVRLLSGEQAALEDTGWSKLIGVKIGSVKARNDDIRVLGVGPAGGQLVLADLLELRVK